MNQYADDDEANHRQNELRGGYGTQIYQGGFASDYDAGTLETYDGNEETDSGGDTVLQVGRYIVNQLFPEIGEGQQDEDDTFYQYCGKCDFHGR